MEEQDKRNFALEPVLNNETGKYVLKNFEQAKEIVADFIEREVNSLPAISNDITLGEVKNSRTYIRKKKDQITQARIQVNALMLGEFNSQLKEIESMLDDADKGLREKVDTYKESIGKINNRPKVKTLVIKGYDEKAIAEIKALATKLGMSVEEK